MSDDKELFIFLGFLALALLIICITGPSCEKSRYDSIRNGKTIVSFRYEGPAILDTLFVIGGKQ